MTTAVPAVYAFPRISEVAANLADHVVGIQNRVLDKEGRRFRIGISGGSLIANLEQGLLQRSDVQWAKWDIFFADERLVPFSSEDSNYGKFKRAVLDKIAGEQPTVYHVDEALIGDPTEAADAYEKQLIRVFAAKETVKLPAFDLLLLGCAPDGHIASLFPNHELLREKDAWVAPVEDAPVAPQTRVTLTLPVLSHSHWVSFLVEGSTKAPVVKTIMERPDKGLPGSLINEAAAGKVAWFVDTDALDGVLVKKKEYKPVADTVNS